MYIHITIYLLQNIKKSNKDGNNDIQYAHCVVNLLVRRSAIVEAPNLR